MESEYPPWPASFPDEWKFNRVSPTLYTVVYNLKPDKKYESLSNNSWDQQYLLPKGSVAAHFVYKGSFVENGKMAHDEFGEIISGGLWDGVGFRSPSEPGAHIITVDFQIGTFTVVKQ